ncbi:MAG: hypothetical protein VXV85_06050 [Candidatus Thermoplasmatota archaeon]|nr:hypothetical protein [Candidatus Thermoplasmatota archaeon]
MSATSAPRGLKPIGLLGGMPFAGSTREFLIKSGYATAIFNGDVVGLADTANSTDDGYLVREAVASEVNPIGVFLGCSYTDPNTGQLTFNQYYPGSIAASDIKAVVSANPFTLYEVQADGAIAQTQLGMTADLVQTQAGSTTTGNSGIQLDASTASVGGECWKIVDFVERVGSTIGDAKTDVIVMMNQTEHAFLADAIT